MEMNATTVINRPFNTVYDYVMDVSNDVHWRTGVIESGLRSDPPVREGSIGYAGAANGEAEYRVVSIVAGKSADWELISGPYQGRGGYRFEQVEGGTQFTLVADLKPSGVFKLMGPLFGWIGRRQNQADVEKLRDILEAKPVQEG
jgi:uncharacterized membrane protein